jgi:uncharacterized protein (UPF0371 family)
LRTILERITGSRGLYRSPTDMGVNRAGFAIVNDQGVREAATQEIIRRHYRYACEHAMGMTDRETVERVEVLMKELGVGPSARPVVAAAHGAAATAKQNEPQTKGNRDVFCGAALQLPNGTIVTGVNSPLLHAASSLIINCLKQLAGLPQHLHLLSPHIIRSIAYLKQDILQRKSVSLDLEETLIALAIASTTNPTAELALAQLKRLGGCEVHLTHMPTPGDETGLRRLGVNLTCDPQFASANLFGG